MCNMKAPSLLVRKLWPRYKFFKRRSNFKVTRFNLACKAFQTKVHLLMASLQYDSNSRPSDHNSCPLPIHVMSHAAGFPSSSLFVCLLAIHFSILFLCHAMSHFNENLQVASAWIYSNRSRSTLNQTVPVNHYFMTFSSMKFARAGYASSGHMYSFKKLILTRIVRRQLISLAATKFELQMSMNSIQQFHRRSRKYLGQSEDRAAILFFLSA